MKARCHAKDCNDSSEFFLLLLPFYRHFLFTHTRVNLAFTGSGHIFLSGVIFFFLLTLFFFCLCRVGKRFLLLFNGRRASDWALT
jgi:hypothetical protein